MLADGNGAAADLAVRVFRLAESNIRRWTGVETKDAEAYAEQLARIRHRFCISSDRSCE